MGWLVKQVKLQQLLRASHRRLRESGLVWLMVTWSALSLLSFYWPSRALLAPWLTRLSAIRHFDLSLLGLPLAAARQSGLVGVLGMIFLVRIVVSPALDAIIYGRLLRPGQHSFSFRGFYRLYLLEILLLLLGGWVVYISQGFWWGLLDHPWLLAFLAVWLGLLAYFAGLALSYYKAGLSVRSQQQGRPRLQLWLVTALAQALLTILFFVLVLGLDYLAWLSHGAGLLFMLLLAGSVRTYGRIWKVACATLAWQAK